MRVAGCPRRCATPCWPAPTGSTDDDLEVLQLVATAPDAVDDRLMPLLGVDTPCLRRLDATGLLVRTRRGIGFRHELARRAVRTAVPLGVESGLHARLLDALEQVGSRDHAVLTHHADAAHDRSRTSRYAALAAEDAARAGSHTEAVAFLTLALDRGDAASAARARMLEVLGQEQYMVSRLPEAIGSITDAIRLWERVGDVRGVAAAHDRGAIIEYYSARRREAEQHARLAVARDDTAAYGSACATQAYLAYRRHDHEAADAEQPAGTRGRRPAPGTTPSAPLRHHRGRERPAARHAQRQGAAAHARGRSPSSAPSTRWGRRHTPTCRPSTSSTGASGRRRGCSRSSIPITVERDIPVCNQWQTGMRARLHFQRARWAAALEDADAVIDGQGMPLAVMWPHLVRGLVALQDRRRAAGEVRDRTPR